jgi:hypothetical protein
VILAAGGAAVKPGRQVSTGQGGPGCALAAYPPPPPLGIEHKPSTLAFPLANLLDWPWALTGAGVLWALAVGGLLAWRYQASA